MNFMSSWWSMLLYAFLLWSFVQKISYYCCLVIIKNSHFWKFPSLSTQEIKISKKIDQLREDCLPFKCETPRTSRININKSIVEVQKAGTSRSFLSVTPRLNICDKFPFLAEKIMWWFLVITILNRKVAYYTCQSAYTKYGTSKLLFYSVEKMHHAVMPVSSSCDNVLPNLCNIWPYFLKH